jgi:tRNA(adenine34) deaminase
VDRDEAFMRLALDEAQLALAHEDVPVGAVLLDNEGNVLGRGHNRREERGDPTAHAEVEALRDAAANRGLWRLDETVLYVTLEPCAMCAGALVNARVAEVVFGAWDKRAGAAESLFRICDDPRLNHRLRVRGGLLEESCRALLQDFFKSRRRRKKPES